MAGADERVRAGVRRRGSSRGRVDREGRLAGLPIAVKDLFDVRGHPTTGCCAAIPPEPAERDAALVTRLRDEGAIVIGKTNQHELAAGVTNLESSCGPTRNPWDLQRITGGSSGGSAVAVATGIVPISLVSDTGGSARIPAAFCGTWGLKPTQGRLSTEGMMSLAPEMDCPGLLAGSLDDLRLGWEVVADQPNDRTAPSVVGLLRGGRWERCALEIKAAVGQAAERFRDTGVEVQRRRRFGARRRPSRLEPARVAAVRRTLRGADRQPVARRRRRVAARVGLGTSGRAAGRASPRRADPGLVRRRLRPGGSASSPRRRRTSRHGSTPVRSTSATAPRWTSTAEGPRG